MNYIRNCDSDSLNLDTLADIACLSRYHFTRVFSEHCHETPIEHVTRIRLEQSISDIIFNTDNSLTKIGMEAGFSSSQAFSNAFSRRFGISPRNFRNLNQWYVNEFPNHQYSRSSLLSQIVLPNHVKLPEWHVEIRNMPATRVAYIRCCGPYYLADNKRSQSGLRLIEWAKHHGFWTPETKIIGICPDNSAVTPPEFCLYDMGIAVADDVQDDDVVSIQTIPSTMLACMHVSAGPSWLARESWRWLMAEWLPVSGMRSTGRAYYEFLNIDFDYPGTKYLGQYSCLPVTPVGD